MDQVKRIIVHSTATVGGGQGLNIPPKEMSNLTGHKYRWIIGL